ncbi:MAG: hypothetical protein AMXMBFR13_25380 [Phycisphaerae bacterium]
MKLPYSLLALDVDGTLMDSRNELPEANRAALHRAHAKGLRICLCTGRSLTEAQAVLDALELDLDAGIFVFGAVVTDLTNRQTISRSPLSVELAEQLVAYFSARGYPLLVLYDRSEAGFDYCYVKGERNPSVYERWLSVTPTQVRRCDSWQAELPLPIRIGVIEAPDCISDTVAALRRQFPPDLMKFNAIYAPNYGVHVVECFAPQVNKWYGITRLTAAWRISDSRVITLGDDVNDVEMIARAGLGVAMGNAVPAVKAVCRREVRSNDECGVAHLIEDLLSGKLPAPVADTTGPA